MNDYVQRAALEALGALGDRSAVLLLIKIRDGKNRFLAGWVQKVSIEPGCDNRWTFMPYVQKNFAREDAQRLARFGNLSRRGTQARPWWPEEICGIIERITWRVYCLGEPGDEYSEFTAYDRSGNVLGVHRVESY